MYVTRESDAFDAQTVVAAAVIIERWWHTDDVAHLMTVGSVHLLLRRGCMVHCTFHVVCIFLSRQRLKAVSCSQDITTRHPCFISARVICAVWTCCAVQFCLFVLQCSDVFCANSFLHMVHTEQFINCECPFTALILPSCSTLGSLKCICYSVQNI